MPASPMARTVGSSSGPATLRMATPRSLKIFAALGRSLATFSGVTWKPGRTGSSTPSNPRPATKSASSLRLFSGHGLVNTVTRLRLDATGLSFSLPCGRCRRGPAHDSANHPAAQAAAQPPPARRTGSPRRLRGRVDARGDEPCHEQRYEERVQEAGGDVAADDLAFDPFEPDGR